MYLICSNISGAVASLDSILAFIATMMECVLSSVPCLADFSAAPSRINAHNVNYYKINNLTSVIFKDKINIYLIHMN